MAPLELRTDGIVLARGLAEILEIQTGEVLGIEVREGRRPVLQVPVIGVTETLLGSPAYMALSRLNRSLHEPGRISGVFLRIDKSRSEKIYKTLKDMPAVASVSLKSDARDAFQRLMDNGAGAMRYIMVAIAAIITFGIVYNSARIAYAERSRDLASLRVIGFTKSEVAFVLLGELAVITVVALPVGAAMGYYLTFVISAGFSTDLYRIPAYFSPESYGAAALAVIGAACISGWLVKLDIDNADLVSALKTRE
jgi:putative ABC transport system permease protein